MTITPSVRAAFATLVLGTAAVAAQAHPAGAASAASQGIDHRQANQTHRIEQGVASGELTPREAHRLQRQQARIGHAERHAKADGHLTRHERRHLHRMQDRASDDIRREKHDRQHQHGAH